MLTLLSKTNFLFIKQGREKFIFRESTLSILLSREIGTITVITGLTPTLPEATPF